MTIHADPRAIRQQLDAYQSQTVETASPARLVSLLFNGALLQIGRARTAIESRSIEHAHEHLIRAQAIVTELSASLNMKDGGELANRLAALYDYCTARLVAANVHKDPSFLDAAVDVLTTLRDAWDEMTGGLLADH